LELASGLSCLSECDSFGASVLIASLSLTC
jgi:hypothetical protein